MKVYYFKAEENNSKINCPPHEKVIGNNDKLKYEIDKYIKDNYTNYLSKYYTQLVFDFLEKDNMDRAIECWNNAQSINKNTCYLIVKEFSVEE